MPNTNNAASGSESMPIQVDNADKRPPVVIVDTLSVENFDLVLEYIIRYFVNKETMSTTIRQLR